MSLSSHQSLLENNVSQASNEFGIRLLNAITLNAKDGNQSISPLPLYSNVFNQSISPLPLYSNVFNQSISPLTLNAMNGNHVISPLSLTTALGMLHLGAKGETNDELRQLLGYNAYNIADSEAHNANKKVLEEIRGTNSSQYVLNVANQIMAQNDYEILVKYMDLLHFNYDASIQKVDFSKNRENAIKTVNEWVADMTNNKITSLFTAPLPSLTRLIVVNAVYLKANWLHKFESYNTIKATFYNNGKTITKVDMMYKAFINYKIVISKELDAEILEIPYSGGDISMYIVLPFKLNGLQKTASLLTEEKLDSAIKSMSSTYIVLYLPKFKIESSYSLTEQLKSLGLVNIFTNFKADLSGINGHRDLYVSDVVHNVFLSVDEDGTEASSLTAFPESGASKGKVMPKVFKVDHPFILLIRHNKNNHNLFYGQISKLNKWAQWEHYWSQWEHYIFNRIN